MGSWQTSMGRLSGGILIKCLNVSACSSYFSPDAPHTNTIRIPLWSKLILALKSKRLSILMQTSRLAVKVWLQIDSYIKMPSGSLFTTVIWYNSCITPYWSVHLICHLAITSEKFPITLKFAHLDPAQRQHHTVHYGIKYWLSSQQSNH